MPGYWKVELVPPPSTLETKQAEGAHLRLGVERGPGLGAGWGAGSLHSSPALALVRSKVMCKSLKFFLWVSVFSSLTGERMGTWLALRTL